MFYRQKRIDICATASGDKFEEISPVNAGASQQICGRKQPCGERLKTFALHLRLFQTYRYILYAKGEHQRESLMEIPCQSRLSYFILYDILSSIFRDLMYILIFR